MFCGSFSRSCLSVSNHPGWYCAAIQFCFCRVKLMHVGLGKIRSELDEMKKDWTIVSSFEPSLLSHWAFFDGDATEVLSCFLFISSKSTSRESAPLFFSLSDGPDLYLWLHCFCASSLSLLFLLTLLKKDSLCFQACLTVTQPVDNYTVRPHWSQCSLYALSDIMRQRACGESL